MTKHVSDNTKKLWREKAKALRRGLNSNTKGEYEDFMDECMDEVGDEDMCQIFWDEGGND